MPMEQVGCLRAYFHTCIATSGYSLCSDFACGEGQRNWVTTGGKSPIFFNFRMGIRVTLCHRNGNNNKSKGSAFTFISIFSCLIIQIITRLFLAIHCCLNIDVALLIHVVIAQITNFQKNQKYCIKLYREIFN
jgi:hypothetical protein